MTYLSENPWPLAGALGLLGLGFLIALRVTQRGKYLVWSLTALGLALAVVAVEWLWVTDAERVEATVYGLARAVEASDADAVASFLAPEVALVQRGDTLVEGPLALAYLRGVMAQARFDFVRVSRMEAQAGAASRRGQANFHVATMGTYQYFGTGHNFAATDSEWSLGLREAEPGAWKVTRISPIRLPRGFALPKLPR